MPAEVSAVVFGLLSALCYGGGDFSGGFASKHSSIYAVVVVSQAVGLALYILLAALTRDPFPPPDHLVWGAVVGIIGAVGLTAFYRALSQGHMGITAPVSGILSAVVPVIVGISSEGLPQPLQLVGFALALIAVWFVSRSGEGGAFNPRLLIVPIFAGTLFGFGFVIFARVTEISTFYPLMASRIASITALTLFALITRQTVVPSSRRALSVIALCGLLDAGANTFFVLSANAGRLDIASVLSTMYPPITVLLAWLILHERLHLTQWIGLGVSLLAIACIAV